MSETIDEHLAPGEVRVRARTESAVFMHSPRGPEYSELRGSAIKGMMRYWMRAALARSAALEELRRFESFVFGDAAQFGTRLAVSVELHRRYEEICTKRSPVPHKRPESSPT